MQTSAISQPTLVPSVMWRKNQAQDIALQNGATNTGQSLNSDKVTISNDASVLSEYYKGATNPGYVVKTANLLTDAEKEKFQKMSDYYGGKKDDEIGKLAVSLAMDKTMAIASKTKVPTLNQEYLANLMNEQSGGKQGNTLHSELDSSLLSDLLNNKHLLA